MRNLLCAAALAILTGCASVPEAEFDRLPAEETSLGDITRFIAAIASSDSITIYEGLPHQTWDPELHASELKRSDLIRIEGYPFYATPLEVAAEEKEKLTEIASQPDAHVPFGGYKMCGGYHPDYAIVWEAGGRKSGSLICFGCHEWKNFTTEGRLYEDLSRAAYEELRSILSKYVAQRPQRKTGDEISSSPPAPP